MRAWVRLTVLALATVAMVGCSGPRPLSSVRASGNELYHDGAYEAAAEEHREIVERRPESAIARYEYARALVGAGRLPEAREQMVIATHLEPGNETYLDLMADTLLAAGSETDLRLFLERQALDRPGWQSELRRGKYLGRLGDVDEGERLLRRAAAMNRGVDPEPQLALAVVYGASCDEDAQLERLRMALGADPRNPEARAALRAMGVVPGPTIMLMPEEQAAGIEVGFSTEEAAAGSE